MEHLETSANFDATAGGPSVKLTSTDQVLIENIGSSYTGNGAGNGYQLFYTAHIDNYALLDADNGAQDMGTITYTIASNVFGAPCVPFFPFINGPL